MATRERLRIVYVLDSAGGARAGGLVSGARVIEGLRKRHDVVSVGVNGDIPMRPLRLPIGDGLVAANSFSFARPDGPRLREVISGADLVHVQLPFFLGFRAMSLARKLGVPVVTAHHVQPENVFATMRHLWPVLTSWFTGPRLAHALNWLMVHTFHRRADLVVFPSDFAREQLLRAGLERPSVVISNGAPEHFRPAPRNRGKQPFTVLSVGRLVPEKRHDLIIEAVRRSKHAAAMRLVIAGKGPLDAKLHALAADHPGRIRLGFVSDDELLALYQTADVYVHASEVELEGMAAVEAMRCGCPTLVCDSPTSATRQFAVDGRHLFRSGDAQDLAAHLDACFENPSGLEGARRRTLAFVRGLGLDDVIARYERAYRQVLEARRADRGEPAPAPALVEHGSRVA